MRAEDVETLRLALWHAFERPPDMLEVARFRHRLKALGFRLVRDDEATVASVADALYAAVAERGLPHGDNEDGWTWLARAALTAAQGGDDQ